MNTEAPMPVTVYMHIDAQLAKALLELNKSYEVGAAGTNRPVRKNIVTKYAQDMLAGNWEITNQGIGLIGAEGHERLIDGQHRLHAILLAAETNPNIRVIMAVTKGLEESASWAIDTNMRRTGADVLAMKLGVRNPNVVSGALRLVYMYKEIPWIPSVWSAFRPTHAQLLEIAAKHPGIEEANALAGAKGFAIPASALTAAVYLAAKERPDWNLPLFLYGLKSGADLHERSPILALRNWGLNALKNRVRREGPVMLALTIRSMNAWCIDDRRTNMRFNPADPFPKITDRPWVSR